MWVHERRSRVKDSTRSGVSVRGNAGREEKNYALQLETGISEQPTLGIPIVANHLDDQALMPPRPGSR